MLTRRRLAALIPPILAAPVIPARAQGTFDAFVIGMKAEARRAGISQATLDRAFAGIRPNERVVELDRKQPEFTLTWAQYRAKVLSDKRIADGRTNYASNAAMLASIGQQFGVDPRICVGIWGLETGYGAVTGGYNVIEALATLAWEGRRAAFFRSQLLEALRILDRGDIAPGQMSGSYAGAMGQPQFMPNSYNTYAVDFDGDGKRDIWGSRADALASIANYLSKSGWQQNGPWGQPILVPPGFDASVAGRSNRRTLGDWMRLGVRRDDRQVFSRQDVQGAVLLPDGAGGAAFMVYQNFNVIRRYNPSDYYSLAVGLLSDAVA